MYVDVISTLNISTSFDEFDVELVDDEYDGHNDNDDDSECAQRLFYLHLGRKESKTGLFHSLSYL